MISGNVSEIRGVGAGKGERHKERERVGNRWRQKVRRNSKP